MEINNVFNTARRDEILENLRKEREKRREALLAEEVEPENQISHGFRSETIARLVQERRGKAEEKLNQGGSFDKKFFNENNEVLDFWEISKNHLQENLIEEKGMRGDSKERKSEKPIPKTEESFKIDYTEDSDTENYWAQKPQKRELPNKYVPKNTKQGKNVPSAWQKPEKPENQEKPEKPEKPPTKNYMKPTMSHEKSDKTIEKPSKNANQSFKESLNSIDKDLKRENFEKRIDELLKLKEEGFKNREIEKKKKEEDEMKKCPFAPQVTPYVIKSFSSEKIEDRLLKLGQEQQKNREKMIKEKEKAEANNTKFVPKISENSAQMIGNRQPIHERIDELQKEKQKIIDELRNNLDARAETNFKPKINHANTSKSSTFRVPGSESSGTGTFTSKKKLIEQLNREEIQNFTFTPVTTGKSPNTKGFLERQEEFLKKKEKKIQNKNAVEETCTFKPVINQNSKFISQEFPGEDKFDRMGKFEQEKRDKKKAQIQEDYYAKFSYEPKINPMSKYLCRNHSATAEVKPQIQESPKEDYSFKPKIETKKKYANVQSHYSNPNAILKNIEAKEKEKQDKLSNIKNEYYTKEQEACTFQPKIVELNEPKENILIHGLDRFMALKELQKKQEEDRKAREHKAFGIKGNTPSVTIPQPFNLAPDKKQDKLEKLKQIYTAEEMKECTFKPKTSESNNMKLLYSTNEDTSFKD